METPIQSIQLKNVCKSVKLATQMQMLLAEHYHSHTLKLHGNERKETAKVTPPCPLMETPIQRIQLKNVCKSYSCMYCDINLSLSLSSKALEYDSTKSEKQLCQSSRPIPGCTMRLSMYRGLCH